MRAIEIKVTLKRWPITWQGLKLYCNVIKNLAPKIKLAQLGKLISIASPLLGFRINK